MPDELPAMPDADHGAGDEAVCNRLLQIGIETFHNWSLPIYRGRYRGFTKYQLMIANRRLRAKRQGQRLRTVPGL